MSFFRIEEQEDEKEARYEAISNIADELMTQAGTQYPTEADCDFFLELANTKLDERIDEARLDYYMAQRGL